MRNKLGEKFLRAVLEDFEKGGVEAIEHVRVNDPSTYVRVLATILPKELTGEGGAPLFSGVTVQFVKAEKK
jgi:hypothetical protein